MISKAEGVMGILFIERNILEQVLEAAEGDVPPYPETVKQIRATLVLRDAEMALAFSRCKQQLDSNAKD
jgi:hypothetical protein